MKRWNCVAGSNILSFVGLGIEPCMYGRDGSVVEFKVSLSSSELDAEVYYSYSE